VVRSMIYWIHLLKRESTLCEISVTPGLNMGNPWLMIVYVLLRVCLPSLVLLYSLIVMVDVLPESVSVYTELAQIYA
jgi:hypothetical protein